MENGNDKNKLTIDERLKFLLESTESLHDQMAQFIEEGRKQREETQKRFERQQTADRKHRRAILVAIQGYLQALDADDGEQ